MGKAITVNYKNRKKTEKFLNYLTSKAYFKVLDYYGKKGVIALSLATPIDSGKTADAWDYTIDINSERTTISWTNSNLTEDGIPVVLLLEYGHATRHGGYVEGLNFINPTLETTFEAIAKSVWLEVTKYK